MARTTRRQRLPRLEVGGRGTYNNPEVLFPFGEDLVVRLLSETDWEAQASLRINVRSNDPQKVGRLFSAKVVELALANYPGFTGRGMTGAGGGATHGGFVAGFRGRLSAAQRHYAVIGLVLVQPPVHQAPDVVQPLQKPRHHHLRGPVLGGKLT